MPCGDGDVRRDVRGDEHLLKASLLMALYSVRSERQFCEQLGYNLLFRWFLDMDMVEPTLTRQRSQRTASGRRCNSFAPSSSKRAVRI